MLFNNRKLTVIRLSSNQFFYLFNNVKSTQENPENETNVYLKFIPASFIVPNVDLTDFESGEKEYGAF